MTEHWINVERVEGGFAVEAFTDGESYGRVLSDADSHEQAADLYLAPYDLELDTETVSPIVLLDTGAVQYRVIEERA